MTGGRLSRYFEGVAAKVLSNVEADRNISNQHEFNGVGCLKNLLGMPNDKIRYPTTFMYLTDADGEDGGPVSDEGFLTWYDARQKAREERGVMREEYRLYFPTNKAFELARAGDVLVIAKRADNELLAMVAAAGSSLARQLPWLFGFSASPGNQFSIRNELGTDRDRVGFTARLVLEHIGVNVPFEGDSWLGQILEEFGSQFPSARTFSAFARSTLPEVSSAEGQDDALIAWMEREEVLFRTLEKHLVEEDLSQGVASAGVDEFVSYALSVVNRRKSRVGLALENHFEFILQECGIRYSRARITERRSRPDFIFPSIAQYQDPAFDPSGLTMLGIKASCKDRWRQVLAEASRLELKHLLTLEAAISGYQTEEMRDNGLQLVVPTEVQASYTSDQREWLLSVADFVELVRKRQP